ncbi:MAG TPA: hypothetical protein VFK85_05605 [Anaeromyxobacteraceae bacterium]|nr:hypothetical protein [Anaeromyxobacteraceae bacterium]
MTSIGIGLLIEEHRGEIAASWRQGVAALGDPEPALGYAIAPLLRELSLALREPAAGARSREAWARCAVLIRSSAQPAQLAREVKALHEAIWGALRASGQSVMPDERSAVDAWLFDALAEFLERAERTRARLDVLGAPLSSAAPPPLPARNSVRVGPPPLPGSGRE